MISCSCTERKCSLLMFRRKRFCAFRRKWALCVFAFLHPLPCCWNNSFLDPATGLITIKNEVDFYFHFIFIRKTQKTSGEAEFLSALLYFLKMLSWAGLSHISIWNSILKIIMSLNQSFYGFCYRFKPGWCCESGSVLCVTFWTKSLTAWTSGVLSPACADLSQRVFYYFSV